MKEDETPKELYARLKEHYSKWVQPQHHTKEESGEIIVLEQFLHMLAPDLQVWIRERDPGLADTFVAAQRKTQPWTFKRWKGIKDSNKLQHSFPTTVRAINEGKSASDKVGSVKQSPGFKVGVRRSLICYHCG